MDVLLAILIFVFMVACGLAYVCELVFDWIDRDGR